MIRVETWVEKAGGAQNRGGHYTGGIDYIREITRSGPHPDDATRRDIAQWAEECVVRARGTEGAWLSLYMHRLPGPGIAHKPSGGVR